MQKDYVELIDTITIFGCRLERCQTAKMSLSSEQIPERLAGRDDWRGLPKEEQRNFVFKDVKG